MPKTGILEFILLIFLEHGRRSNLTAAYIFVPLVTKIHMETWDQGSTNCQILGPTEPNWYEIFKFCFLHPNGFDPIGFGPIGFGPIPCSITLEGETQL